MSSILTNNGAMVALQTLKSINSNLESTQNSIATGKDVSNSKDNAAVWAISKVMESDVSGFKAISDNLGLGQATTSVARQAAETTTDLLKQMKEKIVASQEKNVDREKIQTDIVALREQIGSVTGAAQFNGLNLLSNTSSEEGSGTVAVMSSLDRTADGVTPANISISKEDLTTQAQAIDAAGTVAEIANLDLAGTNAAGNAQTGTIDLSAATVTAGVAYSITLAATDATTDDPYDAGLTLQAGATATNAEAAAGFAYVARDGDTAAEVASGMADAFASWAAENDFDTADFNITATGSTLNVTNTRLMTEAGDALNINVNTVTSDNNVIGGGLAALNDIDVTTDEGAAEALASIETLIQTSIDSAASFGSAENRITTQQDFVSGLMDAMKSGIGTLVDADMEEQSARLQALQVQQQLGVQALSIANQAPQQLMSLFR